MRVNITVPSKQKSNNLFPVQTKELLLACCLQITPLHHTDEGKIINLWTALHTNNPFTCTDTIRDATLSAHCHTNRGSYKKKTLPHS